VRLQPLGHLSVKKLGATGGVSKVSQRSHKGYSKIFLIVCESLFYLIGVKWSHISDNVESVQLVLAALGLAELSNRDTKLGKKFESF